ncbi:MAG: hypothetical protein IJ403_03900 [Oscillospiraceae bacterium]|nr:hypothetical protein [Oscillospiraceae bacterium]
MNQLPVTPLSPEEQQRVMHQIYVLMGKQVESYHKHRHMGSNSSVPVELAQELMESIDYTLQLAGGIYANTNVEETLKIGQDILDGKLQKAKSLYELVYATAPQWQTECRWEALRYLRHYLDTYDHLHLAHREPEELFYPMLVSQPEGIRGVDRCIFYLNVMWIENQIMAGVPDDMLELFWDRLMPETINQCEQLLLNGIGKAILGTGIHSLVFEPEEYVMIISALADATEECLSDAAQQLCQWLNLTDENARMYVNAIIPQLTLRHGSSIENLFV